MGKVKVIGYPSGQIVKIKKSVFDYIKGFEEFRFDDEWTEETPNGQWGFDDSDEDSVIALKKFVGEDMVFKHDYLEHELSYKEISEGLIKVYLNDKWVATFEIWQDSEMDNRQYIIINHTIIYLDTLKEKE